MIPESSPQAKSEDQRRTVSCLRLRVFTILRSSVSQWAAREDLTTNELWFVTLGTTSLINEETMERLRSEEIDLILKL